MAEEILAKRTENSKTYWLGGSKFRTTISIAPIHYKDNYADNFEQWKDIDLTWVDNRITKAPYEATRDKQKLTLKNKKTGAVSTIELLESSPAGLAWNIVLDNTAISFRHLLPSDKIPFSAKFRITGIIPFSTKAFDDDGEFLLATSLVDDILTESLTSLRDKFTGVLRPSKGVIRIDPTWQIGTSTDDVHRRFVPDGLDLTYINWISGYQSGGYYRMGNGGRFANITIPNGATISSAYLTFRANQSLSGTVVRTRISAEDVDNAPTFTNDKNVYDTRYANRTTARMDWDAIPAWTVDIDYDSPTTDGVTTFASIIQEVIDRAGWASGNAIVIFWEDYDDRSTHASFACRYAYSFDGLAANAPKLVIEYTGGAVKNLYGGNFANENRFNRRGF